ncbi:MAG: amino acid permease [Chlamydiia bacterium]|nr:amino acid permease [Chlamydiia bacterium]
MTKKIPLFSLVMLIVAAIDSIRNLPAMGLFGSYLIFFFLLSAVLFLLPTSLISAEFSSRYPEEGGIFHWVRHAFGPKGGLIAVWLQWINTMVWYPTMLSFIAGTLAYLFDPALAQNKAYLASVILVVFWGLTLLNLRGIHVSAKINNFCAVMGTLAPMTLIMACGIWWFVTHPSQIDFGKAEWVPTLGMSQNWVALIAIMASFLGMELSGVHVNDIANPRKNFPKAIGISIVVLLCTMLLSSLSIAVVIPEKEIRLVDGVMQFFSRMGWPAFVPILTVMIIVGSLGNMINWLLSPAKGLLQAAEYGFLPKFFCKKNAHGVAVPILIIQAVFVSLFCLAFILMPSVNAFYWFLTDLSTELYMLMYLLMFAAALKLGRAKGEHFAPPKGTRTLLCSMGMVGALLTVVVGYFPPSEIDVGSGLKYGLLIAAGNLILVAPVLWMFRLRKKH